VPYRGRTNTPALVPVVGAAVAAVKGLAPEVVEEATWVNTAAVFRLPDGLERSAVAGHLADLPDEAAQ
jgi:hypothetical protein